MEFKADLRTRKSRTTISMTEVSLKIRSMTSYLSEASLLLRNFEFTGGEHEKVDQNRTSNLEFIGIRLTHRLLLCGFFAL